MPIVRNKTGKYFVRRKNRITIFGDNPDIPISSLDQSPSHKGCLIFDHMTLKLYYSDGTKWTRIMDCTDTLPAPVNTSIQDVDSNTSTTTEVCIKDTETIHTSASFIPNSNDNTIFFKTAGLDRAIFDSNGVLIVTAGSTIPSTITPKIGNVAHFEGNIKVNGSIDSGVLQFSQHNISRTRTDVQNSIYVNSSVHGAFSNGLVFVDGINIHHMLGDLLSPGCSILTDTLVRFGGDEGKITRPSPIILNDMGDFSNPMGDIGIIPASKTGSVNITGNTTISKTLNVGENLIITGNTSILKDLDVEGNVSISKNVNIMGNSSISRDLHISGNASIKNNIIVGDHNISNSSKRCVIVGGHGGTVIGDDIWLFTHGSSFSPTGNGKFYVKNTGGTYIYSNDKATTGVSLHKGSSSWASISDINKKENLIEVDCTDILENVKLLPIYKYNYIGNPKEQRNIGPVAQDWHKLFPCESIKSTIKDDKSGKIKTLETPPKDLLSIEIMDLVGVCISSIKSLAERVDILSEKVSILSERVNYLSEQ